MMRLLLLLTTFFFLLKTQAAMPTLPCATQVDTALAAVNTTPLSNDTWQCKSAKETVKLSKAPEKFFKTNNPSEKILCFFDSKIPNLLTEIDKLREDKVRIDANLEEVKQAIIKNNSNKRVPTERDAKNGAQLTVQKVAFSSKLSTIMDDIVKKGAILEKLVLIELSMDQLKISKDGAHMFVNNEKCKFAFQKKPNEKKPMATYDSLAEICNVFKKNKSKSPFCEASPGGSAGAGSTAPATAPER